jgi:hypothetical protein
MFCGYLWEDFLNFFQNLGRFLPKNSSIPDIQVITCAPGHTYLAPDNSGAALLWPAQTPLTERCAKLLSVYRSAHVITVLYTYAFSVSGIPHSLHRWKCDKKYVKRITIILGRKRTKGSSPWTTRTPKPTWYQAYHPVPIGSGMPNQTERNRWAKTIPHMPGASIA